MKIRLMTDTAADLNREDEERYNIRILTFPVVVDGETYRLHGNKTKEEFYQMLENSKTLPKTAQINPAEIEQIYLEEAEAGYTDIIYVAINAKGSATFGNAEMAVDAFFEDYPQYAGKVNIYPVDGMGYCALYGAPVVDAAKMIEKGETAENVVSYLKEIMPRREVYFGMYSLKWAGKSGRIPTAAAFIGDKLNLKPIMRIHDNQITTAAKVRSENKMIDKLVQMAKEEMEPGTAYQLICGSDPSVVVDVGARMKSLVGYDAESTYQIGAVVACNAGPKVAGIAFTKKKA